MRDNLEIAFAYLKSSKDNFGPARHWAIALSQEAIVEFERWYGEPGLEPTPGTEKASYVGSHGHPRMNRAYAALTGLARDLSRRECLQDTRLDTLRDEIGQTIAAIDAAMRFNPPYSHH